MGTHARTARMRRVAGIVLMLLLSLERPAWGSGRITFSGAVVVPMCDVPGTALTPADDTRHRGATGSAAGNCGKFRIERRSVGSADLDDVLIRYLASPGIAGSSSAGPKVQLLIVTYE
jgi:hypothetical protein